MWWVGLGVSTAIVGDHVRCLLEGGRAVYIRLGCIWVGIGRSLVGNAVCLFEAWMVLGAVAQTHAHRLIC